MSTTTNSAINYKKYEFNSIDEFYDNFQQLQMDIFTNSVHIDLKDDGNYYYVKGNLHRLDGPAMIHKDTYRWFIDGKEISFEVNKWIRKNDITFPFDENTQTLFLLKFR